MKKYGFAAVLLALALLLCSCGPHKKEDPSIPLDGLEKVSFVLNGNNYDLNVGGRQYNYIKWAEAKYISIGKVIAYELVEGGISYKYYAELFGSSDVIARFRAGSRGELPSGKDTVELYAAADLAEIPYWASQLCAYPEFDTDYIENLNFTAKYIRTEGMLPDRTFPYALLIDDRASLDRYIEDNKAFYGFDANNEFSAVAERYNGDWFKTHQLVIAVVEEGSGSIAHEVQWIYKDKTSKCFVIIDRLVPEVGTADMAHWHILMEVERVNLPFEPSYPRNLTQDFDIQVRLFTVREKEGQ